MQFEISALARKYAPWSYSKADLAETCPAQFKFKHLDKHKGTAQASDNTVGIVAHEILEHRVAGKTNRDARAAALAKTPLMTGEAEQLRTFDENMEHFLQRFDRFCKAQGVSRVFTEVAWGITEDYRPTDFYAKDVYFRGKLDLGAITGDGTLFVLDHKSGFAKDLKDDPKKREQLQAYGVLAVPNLPEIAGVRAGIHFLQGDNPDLRLQWTDFISAQNIRSAYAPWLYERINTCASNLAHDKFEARVAKKKKKGWPCHWCSYQSVCAPYKEKHGG